MKHYVWIVVFLMGCSSSPKKPEVSKVDNERISPANGAYKVTTTSPSETCVSKWNPETKEKVLSCRDTGNNRYTYPTFPINPNGSRSSQVAPHHPAYSNPGNNVGTSYVPPGYKPSDINGGFLQPVQPNQ